MADDMKEVFSRLRPICVQLASQHTQENVHTLSQAISSVSDKQLSELQDYVMFPLRLILKHSKEKSSELYTDVVQCLCQVISRTEIKNWDTLQDIFNSLCLLISGPDNSAELKSEEFKLAVVDCLSSLVGSAARDPHIQLYQPTFLPPMGHAISLLLGILTNERYHRLQTAAARCLLQLVTVKYEDELLRARVGGSVSSFLPGITLATTRVITGDEKQSQAVTTAALDVWTESVAVVMGDENLDISQKEQTDKISEDSKMDAELAERLASLRVSRSEDWVKATAGKLGVLIDKIVTIATHPKWQVRLAMVKWAKSLIIRCGRSMPDATGPALDVLVQLAADEYDSVASSSQGALGEVRVQMDLTRGRELRALMVENLHDLATRLPRLMRTADDDKKMATLILFTGYTKLLGDGVRGMLHSAAHLQRISMALIQVLELDNSHLELVQEVHTGMAFSLPDAAGVGSGSRYYFKHFRDERILQQIKLICRILGYYGDLDLLVDHFLEISHQGSLYRKQTFLVINQVLLGANGHGLENLKEANVQNKGLLKCTVGTLLEEYLSPFNWDLPTQAESEKKMTSSQLSPHDWQVVPIDRKINPLVERTNNILQICLLLDGIAGCAQALGHDFRVHLVDVLYPLMERLGDSMAAINTSAHMASHSVAVACGYCGIQEMVCHNSDYLVNSISLRLRHIERHPQSPCVLQAILRHTTADILPLFEDIVHEVILVLDEHYDTSALLFMQVLYALVQAIITWHPPSTTTSQSKVVAESRTEEEGPTPAKLLKGSSHDSKVLEVSQSNLVSFLLDYHKTKIMAEGEVDMEDATSPELDAEDDEIMETNDETKKEIPQHIQIVKEILERCCHLMSAPETALRLLVLRTVAAAFVAMQSEQNELLPLAHKIWAPFVKRFVDQSPLVSLEAIRTLTVIGETTGDFLWRRVSSEVLPPMADFLKKQAKVSAGSGRQYRHTVLSKLQVAVINTLASICSQIRVTECLLHRVALSCIPYLSVKQPEHLQKAALSAFHHFITCDPDTVWLVLIDVFCPLTLVHPDPRFTQIKEGPRERNEYSDNVNNLLQEIT